MAKKEKIETLRKRKEEIEKKLSTLEARERAQARKDETRLKVLIGAGIMADLKKHPENLDNIKKILDRAATSKRDRDFLTSKGWLPEAKPPQEPGQ